MATRLFSTLRYQSPILIKFAKNASVSTNFSPQIYKERPRDPSLYQYQCKRYSHCSRKDPCVEKKKELKEREARDKQKSFWQSLFDKPKRKPPIQTCRKIRQENQWKEEKIPEFIKEMCEDLPEGSAIYKTRGHAFILEIPCKQVPCEKRKTRSEVQLSRIERSKQCIDLEDASNPMPCYSSVGKRLIDLADRKLHPLYKKLEMPVTNHPKPYKLETKYRCVSDELAASDKSSISQLDLYHLRKKISFANFKMGVLPRYLETREKEYQMNPCSTLETRKEVMEKCKGKGKFRICPITTCPEIDCCRWNNQKPRK